LPFFFLPIFFFPSGFLNDFCVDGTGAKTTNGGDLVDVEREQNNTHGGNENKGKENATVSVPLWVERMTQWSVGEGLYPSTLNETVL
tara:strand:+ start:1351 stop:1611 length:261 start_codon:yes stop_codon:yes gene_type:complete